MSSLPVFRVLRPLGLVAACAVAAFASSATAGMIPGVDAATMQTREFSCSSYGFLPDQSGTTYQHAANTELYGQGSFVCNAALPNKAVVTKVEFTIQDLGSGGNLQFCGLVRMNLTAASAGTFSNMAMFPATNNEGLVRLSTTNIDHATVDETTYAYELQCQINGNETNFGLYGATVVYKISAANG